MENSKDIFTKIYETQAWGKTTNKEYNGSSGAGSDALFNIKTYVPKVKAFIENNNIKSIADIGCGEFISGPDIYDNLEISYTGYDVYKNLINHLNKKYKNNKKYNFIQNDAILDVKNISKADLCILKDILQHWPTLRIVKFLDYVIKNKIFKYILICNSSIEYHITHDSIITIDRAKDTKPAPDILLGDFRSLSCKILPLSKYPIKKLYNYKTKEVSLIDLSKS
jgi:hypothetical protein